MRIERYIIAEVLKPFLAVLGILLALFACFSVGRYLAAAVTETLGIIALARLVLLKTMIASEVLVPVALYFSVIMGLGRLYRDREIVALRAAGVGPGAIIRAILILAVPVSILVGCLSVAARPWAYAESYLLDAEARAEFSPARVQAGKFYGSEESGRVLYAQRKDPDTLEMQEVFLFRRGAQASTVVNARRAEHHENPATGKSQLHLFEGQLYRLPRDRGADQVTEFDDLVFNLTQPDAAIGYRRKAAATATLLASAAPAEIAEWQWRLSRPLATLLLVLVAVPLSRATPGQGRHERSIVAALVFAVYYNLSGLAQSWVEQGVVGAIPGVWWLHGLMAAGVIWILRAGTVTPRTAVS
ncbi:MAG: LPS export ABC transporter permease LptF [Gammaproteobacteria bacterium]|nr:LPS export ABC transporter permease LptF [Gammaproteobacteria bacterium]